jgi:hypothetical protein
MEWERALLSAAQPFAGSCVHTGLKSNCVHANRKGEYRTIIRQARLCGHNIQIKNTLKRATWVSPKAGQFTGGGGAPRNDRAAATSVPVEPEPKPKPNEWHEIMHS